MLSLKDGRERREYWQHAAKLLLEVADGGSLEAATDQLMLALMLDGTLDMMRTAKGERIMNRKIEAARRQLGTALSLYLDDADPVSVLCLAGGGCEIIEHFATKAGGKPFASHALEEHPGLNIEKLHRIQRKYWNAFKHALDRKGRERDDEELLAAFNDKQNDHMLFIGWYDYEQARKMLPIEAQVHQHWYLALYPEKLNPKVSTEPYDRVFPNLRTLPRSKQKLRLRKAIARARADRHVMRDPRTEKRTLIIGWS